MNAKKLAAAQADPKSRLKTRQDFLDVAQAQAAEIIEGANHTRIKTPKGATALARHGKNKDLPEGTRCALIRQFKLLGLLSIIGTLIYIGSHLI